MAPTKRERRGRPPTARGKHNPIPVRVVGRVDDEPWNEIKQGASAAGAESFTAWATAVLLRAARAATKKAAGG